jgi:hypothetical protein
MQGLNDLDQIIAEKTFLFDLLLLLDESENKAFLGFYLRFLQYSSNLLKVSNKINENLIKLFELLLKLNWLPGRYSKLLNRFESMSVKLREKTVLHVYDYLNKENEEKMMVQFKILMIDNNI